MLVYVLACFVRDLIFSFGNSKTLGEINHMAKKNQYTWDETKVVDDVGYDEHDEELFRQMIESSTGTGE